MRQSEFIEGLSNLYPPDADDLTLDKLFLLDILIGEAADCLDTSRMSYGCTWFSLNGDITLNIHGDVPTAKRNYGTAAKDLLTIPDREPKLLSSSLDLLDKHSLPVYKEAIRHFFRICFSGKKLVGIIKNAGTLTVYCNDQHGHQGNNFQIVGSNPGTDLYLHALSNSSWLLLIFNVLIYNDETKPRWSTMKADEEPKLAAFMLNRAIKMFLRKRPDSLLLRQ